MSIPTADNETEWAFHAFLERRLANKGRKPIDNSKLQAGEPMHFVCSPCNGDIVVEEVYKPPRPQYCAECTKLELQGLLQEFVGRINQMKK